MPTTFTKVTRTSTTSDPAADPRRAAVEEAVEAVRERKKVRTSVDMEATLYSILKSACGLAGKSINDVLQDGANRLVKQDIRVPRHVFRGKRKKANAWFWPEDKQERDDYCGAYGLNMTDIFAHVALAFLYHQYGPEVLVPELSEQAHLYSGDDEDAERIKSALQDLFTPERGRSSPVTLTSTRQWRATLGS